MAERGCGLEPATVPRGPQTPYTGVQTGAPGQERVGLGRRAATIRRWSWLSNTPLALLWAARSGPPLPEGTTPGPLPGCPGDRWEQADGLLLHEGPGGPPPPFQGVVAHPS